MVWINFEIISLFKMVQNIMYSNFFSIISQSSSWNHTEVVNHLLFIMISINSRFFGLFLKIEKMGVFKKWVKVLNKNKSIPRSWKSLFLKNPAVMFAWVWLKMLLIIWVFAISKDWLTWKKK